MKTCRPTLDLERVSTGEYWHGRQALELGLIDEILSSDEYIFTKRLEADLYKIEMQTKKKWSEKLAENMSDAVAKSLERIWLRGEESRWF